MPPRRVFLDTCILNLLLDYGDQIFQGVSCPPGTNGRLAADIEALEKVWDVGERAFWELAVSPLSHREVTATADGERARNLESSFVEIWEYWRSMVEGGYNLPTFMEAEETRIGLYSSGVLDVLPDAADKLLITDAVVYRCELFCTRDYRTILKHRADLASLPLRIVTPQEWWQEIERWLIANSR